MAVRQTACRHCEQDIENFSPYRKGEWRDRGGNTHCPGRPGQLHAPVIERRFNHVRSNQPGRYGTGLTLADKRKLLRNFTKQVADHLLKQSARWPADWDGHEIRELVAAAFNHERTRLMADDHKRKRAAVNAMIVERLY